MKQLGLKRMLKPGTLEWEELPSPAGNITCARLQVPGGYLVAMWDAAAPDGAGLCMAMQFVPAPVGFSGSGGERELAPGRWELRELNPKERMKALEPTPEDLEEHGPQETITVCAACLCARCWRGELMCELFRTAGTIDVTRAQFAALDREPASVWEEACRT